MEAGELLIVSRIQAHRPALVHPILNLGEVTLLQPLGSVMSAFLTHHSGTHPTSYLQVTASFQSPSLFQSIRMLR